MAIERFEFYSSDCNLPESGEMASRNVSSQSQSRRRRVEASSTTQKRSFSERDSHSRAEIIHPHPLHRVAFVQCAQEDLSTSVAIAKLDLEEILI